MYNNLSNIKECLAQLLAFVIINIYSRSLELIDERFEEICHDDQDMLAEGDKNFEMLSPDVKAATAKALDRFTAVMNYLENNKVLLF